MDNSNLTAVEWLVEQMINQMGIRIENTTIGVELFEQAKQMEKEKHDAWNAFLEREKTLGISDVKTIERIQWYYNQYYKETYGKD